MKTLLLLIISLFVAIDSFGQNDSTSPPELPDFSRYFSDTLIVRIFDKKAIQIDYNEEFELYRDTLITSDKIVFEYNKIHKEFFTTSSNYNERVVFEIDSSINQFEFKDNDLLGLKCIMDIGSHDDWWEYQDYSVSNGVISGKKTPSGDWKIKADINNGRIDSRFFYKVQFEETFTNVIKER
jgi:hypothetical protein